MTIRIPGDTAYGNTYTINGGLLDIANNARSLPGSVITVDGGALQVGGTLEVGGEMTVADGTVSAGNAVRVESTGELNLFDGAEVNSTFDLVNEGVFNKAAESDVELNADMQNLGLVTIGRGQIGRAHV